MYPSLLIPIILLVGLSLIVESTPLLGLNIQLPGLGVGGGSGKTLIDPRNGGENAANDGGRRNQARIESGACPEDGILPANYFMKLPSVLHVNLTECSITEIDSGAFAGISNVQALDLSSNDITTINGALSDLPELRNLNLSKNGLTEIRRDMFTNNARMQWLVLSYNKITRIVPKAFQQMSQLLYLDLSHNHITKLHANVISGFSHLTIIHLENNLINELSSGCFDGMNGLVQLFLDNNKLSAISNDIFDGEMQKLKVISFANNQLTHVQRGFMELFPNLAKISIVGNPWQCACFNEMSKWIVRNKVHYLKHNYYEGKRPVCVVGTTDVCDRSMDDYSFFKSTYKTGLARYAAHRLID